MASGRPKRIKLNIHQLRPLLELCDAAKEFPELTPRETALREVGEEAKDVLWTAINKRSLSEMTRMTLETAPKTFKVRKRACKIKTRLTKLKNEAGRCGYHPGRSWKLLRWQSSEARLRGRRPLKVIKLEVKPKHSSCVRSHLREVQEMIDTADRQFYEYKENQTAAKFIQADDKLEKAKKCVEDGSWKLKELVPVWDESSDEEYSSAASDTEDSGDSD